MNPSTTALTLNMQLPNIATVSWAVQGDQLSRVITATLVDGSTPWTPEASYHGVVRFHKPDGTNGVYDVDEDGNPAVTWSGNVATIKIAQQALTCAGSVVMQLEFYDTNNARITAFGWFNNVQPSAVTDTEFLSTDYYNILTLQISAVLEVAGEMTPYSETPEMDGVGSPGTSVFYSRGDHVHPTDTSRASVEELENYYNVIRVNTDGSGDYTTISDAVTAASDDDIILVYPGTYFETVHAYNKLVHIKGIDKKTCILEYHGKDYANPPLEMAKGSVENLTIIARNSGTAGDANAYCVHIDNDEEEGQSLYFCNVSCYNEIHQAVGIGLRHNFDLAFESCEFEAISQAALYCHDWETNDTSADKTGQKITLLNCTLKNNDATHATIMLQSQELATNCAACKFTGCAVYNANANGNKISMTMWQGRTLTNASFLGSSDWVLDGGSSLNTEPLINATKDFVVEQYTFSVTGGITSGTIGRRAAQVYLPDIHPDLTITGIQVVNIQSSADYNPMVFYSSGNIYCNYYAATENASQNTQVVARVTYK